MQPIACQLIREGFSEYGADPAELQAEGHVFSRHFKPSENCHDPATGLHALVAAADQARSDCHGYEVTVPPPHSAAIEDVQARGRLDHSEIQRSNGIVPAVVDGSSVHSGCYTLPLDGQAVTIGERHSGVYNTEPFGQTVVNGMIAQQPLIGEALEESNDWRSHLQGQTPWQTDAAMAQAGHVEWEEWLLSLEPIECQPILWKDLGS